MSRRARHAPEAVEVLGTVRLSARKGLRFGIAREGGMTLGQIEHIRLAPDGRAIARPNAQRIVLSEPVALQIVEALARVGVRLREVKP